MKKMLPFAWVREGDPFSKKARVEDAAFRKGLYALVKRFGFQRILCGLVAIACHESVRGLKTHKGPSADGRLYSDAYDVLSHAEATLGTIVRLRKRIET